MDPQNETQLPESEEGPQGVEADEIYLRLQCPP